MPSEPEKIEIRVSAEFKRSLRTLSKRYRSIRSDIQPIIERLQSGEVMGDRISGTGYAIFKVRVKIVISKKVRAAAIASSIISRLRLRFY